MMAMPPIITRSAVVRRLARLANCRSFCSAEGDAPAGQEKVRFFRYIYVVLKLTCLVILERADIRCTRR